MIQIHEQVVFDHVGRLLTTLLTLDSLLLSQQQNSVSASSSSLSSDWSAYKVGSEKLVLSLSRIFIRLFLSIYEGCRKGRQSQSRQIRA